MRDSRVPHGDALLGFADAVLVADDAALEGARRAVAAALGDRAVADAAAIVASFQLVDRVADATGIPLDAVLDVASQDVQAELGLRAFASASNTPARRIGRVAGRVLAPLRTRLLKLVTRAAR